MSWKRSIVTLPLLLLIACSKPCPPCPPTGPAPLAASNARATTVLPPVPANKIRVKVTIAITGIAHLIDDGGGKLVIFPNGTGYSTKHELLLLVSKIYSPTGLSSGPKDQVVGGTVVDTFYYSTVTPGMEIDLAKSGFDSTLNPSLSADATGDSTNEACPSPQLAPASSLHWLPDLKKVSHASGVMIDPDQTIAMPNPNVVSARLKITGGALTAKLPGPADVFEFKTSGSGDVTQAVAESLNFTYLVDVDKTNPVIELWGGPYRTASTKLATAKASLAAQKVTFYLANVPPGEFFAPAKHPTLPHFHHYYDIYKTGVGSHMVAVPTRGKPEDSCGGPLGGGVECGPDRP